MRKIPKCMSTQHPDNVNLPFFAENSVLSGEDEIQEAYYAYSHLGCDEQLWDYEGKHVDNFVVKKLLTKYETYFSKNKLGKDKILTFRVPNPDIEKAEAKILLETLESIPRSFDAAKIFYGEEITPVFEIILPMCSSAKSIDRIYNYYHEFVVGKKLKRLSKKDITVKEWIGDFKPETLEVTPLFEDMSQMLNSDKILSEFLQDKEIKNQRAFLARSDPALNYGNVSAVLLNKIALFKIYNLSKNIGVKIYPIIGAGSAPFRGNLSPETTKRTAKGYPSCHTFTIQSSYKYDNDVNNVKSAVEFLMDRSTSKPLELEEEKCVEIMRRYGEEYQNQVKLLAPHINKISKSVPKRRKRKLHIGLFGYSRDVGEVKLPRAITFTASLYSLGCPPELLGLNALTEKDMDYIKNFYFNFEGDLKDALRYVNFNAGFVPTAVELKLKEMQLDYELNDDHKQLTLEIVKGMKKNANVDEQVLRAAHIRKFLG